MYRDIILLTVAVFLFSSITSTSFANDVLSRPFSKEDGCTSGKTNLRERKSCNGSFTWPEGAETPPGEYIIDVNTVKVVQLDHRGTGSGCGTPRYTYKNTTATVPGIGTVSVQVPIKVTVGYNARGHNRQGTRGRVECRVVGKYQSL